jgi:hypothetical protein
MIFVILVYNLYGTIRDLLRPLIGYWNQLLQDALCLPDLFGRFVRMGEQVLQPVSSAKSGTKVYAV